MTTKSATNDLATPTLKIRVWKQGKELGYVRLADGHPAVVFDVNHASKFFKQNIAEVMLNLQHSPLPGAKPPPLTFSILSI